MKSKGKWHGQPFRDFKENKWLVTFELETEPKEFDELHDKELSIEVKAYRQKRSLNANAYFHVLVDKIAEKMKATHTEIHNWLIANYGQTDDEVGIIILEDRIDWHRVDAMHLRPIPGQKQTLANGKMYQAYKVMRGSHTYDTAEMARLIDGTVSEAKELGIETMTPDELERMKAQWQEETKA